MYSEPFGSTGCFTGRPSFCQVISDSSGNGISTNSVVSWPVDVLSSTNSGEFDAAEMTLYKIVFIYVAVCNTYKMQLFPEKVIA